MLLSDDRSLTVAFARGDERRAHLVDEGASTSRCGYPLAHLRPAEPQDLALWMPCMCALCADTAGL